MSVEEKAFEEMKAIIRNDETTLTPELIGICQEALRKCKEEYCNGWTNRETWLFNLWITNDEEYYHHFYDRIDEVMDQEYPIQVMSNLMEEFFNILVQESVDFNTGILNDLLGSLKARINFYEVAKAFLEV